MVCTIQKSRIIVHLQLLVYSKYIYDTKDERVVTNASIDEIMYKNGLLITLKWRMFSLQTDKSDSF